MSRRLPLFTSLLLTFAFAVAGLGVLINAFVKADDERISLQQLLPSGTIVRVQDSDILSPGKVSCAIHALLIVLSVLSLSAVSISRFATPKSFLVLALSVGFASVWLLATSIAFTVIFADKIAGLEVVVSGFAVPESVIQGESHTLGLSLEYKQNWYLRVATIIPWFTWLFSALSCVFLLLEWMTTAREEIAKGGGMSRKDKDAAARHLDRLSKVEHSSA